MKALLNEKNKKEIEKIILSIIGKPNRKKNKCLKIKNEKKIEEEINKAVLEQKKQETLDLILETSKENIKRFKNFIPKDSEYIFLQRKKDNKEKINLNYQFKKDKNFYSVNVNYKLNEDEEKLEVNINIKDQINKNIEKYNLEIIKKPQQYIISEKYNNHEIKYTVPKLSYHQIREDKIQDFTNAVDKSLTLLPKSIMGGVLGFTYLGENFMARRDDLTGAKALMVDVHEAIHTPDEYETRVLTAWMLKREMPKYKR